MANYANVTGTVILTVPPNKTWQGVVLLSATVSVAVGGSNAVSYPSVDVTTSGGASWANGDKVAALALFVPAVGATALTGAQTSGTISTGEIFVQTGANPVTLTLNFNSGSTSAMAVAVGGVLN